MPAARPLLTAITLAVTVSAAACTSASSTLVTPTSDKCQGQIAASAPASSFAPTGGTGTIAVNAPRDCTWAAATDAPWIAFESAASGQGEATITYRVMPNTTPFERRSQVTLAAARLDIAQQGAPCRFSLNPTAASVPGDGGLVTVSVAAMTGCGWTAASSAGWLTILSGLSGNGAGEVVFSVAVNTGGARTAAVTIADQTLTVAQADATAPPPATPVPTPDVPPPQPTPPQPSPSPAPKPAPPAPTPLPQPPPTPIERTDLSGEPSQLQGACPDVTFVLRGLTVVADAATDYSRNACADLASARRVEVTGWTMSDGTVRAEQIEIRGRGGDQALELVW